MSVAQFEDLCDAGQISANLETFVLEMTAEDRQTFRRNQPEQYAQDVRDLQALCFDLRVLERVAVFA
jgi:hypothetical protein